MLQIPRDASPFGHQCAYVFHENTGEKMLDTHTRNRLLRLPEVRDLTGKSRSAIYREIRAGSFPRQLALGPRTAAWSEAEVAAWINARIRARDGARA